MSKRFKIQKKPTWSQVPDAFCPINKTLWCGPPTQEPTGYLLTSDNGYKNSLAMSQREPVMNHLMRRPFVNNETCILKGVQFQHIHYPRGFSVLVL